MRIICLGGGPAAKFPQAATHLDEARDDVLAFSSPARSGARCGAIIGKSGPLTAGGIDQMVDRRGQPGVNSLWHPTCPTAGER